MKQCPKCHQTYNDNNLNFCLEDGELLTGFTSEPPPARYIDDSPPTMVMNDARVTNPANWPQTPPSAPVGQWQPPPQNLQNQPYKSPGFTPSLDQTLPIIVKLMAAFGRKLSASIKISNPRLTSICCENQNSFNVLQLELSRDCKYFFEKTLLIVRMVCAG